MTACASTSTPRVRASSSAAAARRPTGCAPGCCKITGNPKIHFNIQEIKQPELDATLHRAGRRRPAHRSRLVPPGDEARGADRDEGRRPGHPRAVQRPPRWRRDEPQGVVPRGPGAAAHAARRHRLRPRRGQDHVRPHRREGLDLQGRDPPVQVGGRGQDRQGSRDGGRRDVGPGPAAPRRQRRWRSPPARRPSPTPGRRRRPTSVDRKRRAPLVKEADPELERLLAEEEEIERRTRQHHETPKFHGDED